MFRLINKLKNRKGFTLIELIVVLAVLAIIMAIAVPRFMGVRDQAAIDADFASGALIAKTAEIYAVKGLTETQIETKLGEDFPDGVDFKSDKIDSYSLSNVNITITSTGGIEVDVVSGSNSYQIYPESNDLD